MSRRARIVPIAVAVSLAFAACGEDDEDGKRSKSELAEKASAICEEAEDARREITAPEDLTTNPVAAAAYYNKIVPISQKQTDDLAELKPADDVKTDWTQLVNRQKQANETLTIIRDKAEAKDPSAARDLAKAERVRAKFAAEAEVIGATTCAEG